MLGYRTVILSGLIIVSHTSTQTVSAGVNVTGSWTPDTLFQDSCTYRHFINSPKPAFCCTTCISAARAYDPGLLPGGKGIGKLILSGGDSASFVLKRPTSASDTLITGFHYAIIGDTAVSIPLEPGDAISLALTSKGELVQAWNEHGPLCASSGLQPDSCFSYYNANRLRFRKSLNAVISLATLPVRPVIRCRLFGNRLEVHAAGMTRATLFDSKGRVLATAITARGIGYLPAPVGIGIVRLGGPAGGVSFIQRSAK